MPAARSFELLSAGLQLSVLSISPYLITPVYVPRYAGTVLAARPVLILLFSARNTSNVARVHAATYATRETEC